MAQSTARHVMNTPQPQQGQNLTPAETDNKPRQKSPSSHILASQLASAVSTTMFYPMDTLRIRYMSQDGTIQRQHNGQTYRSIYRAVGVIWKEEGLRALFRGCHVAVLGAVVAWGVYMFVYHALCDLYIPTSNKRAGDDFLFRTVLSSIASCSCAVVGNPIWLLKTRMQIEEIASREAAVAGASIFRNSKNYTSFFGGLRYAIQTDGVLSLWRGVSAQVLLGLPNALNFPAYEALKSFWLQRSDRETLYSYEACICSTASKTAVSIIGYPLHVVKTRMQDQRSRRGDLQYVSFLQSAWLVLQTHGFAGLYRGMVPSLLHSVPRLALTFVLYEKLMQQNFF
ncbi:mitochondrial carrier protein, putative [Trypanosoma brucei gambiense DAL972]|uniref:Mitochondrial carrier protein, putative n=2 Tax=Trypanosoma brucei TaxID=5691 RepID=D0A9Z0_TRYB9|nr:mitochondrial carrier protein, putative [Trypanosoma brucei gambiense DAL972]RHW68010.1 mitochondrial carrier protein [Trypanosoma brucei equiperdum]CBH18491.1 mitochondrial carrier protein, putative [Trypanosoma brucei gambiense DAL972]|eukprot:XP_011780755.1 mitochondrial carrier protein, putative [Trypanosoma brucei gambiense DAL972]